jgi:hypothetical protein
MGVQIVHKLKKTPTCLGAEGGGLKYKGAQVPVFQSGKYYSVAGTNAVGLRLPFYIFYNFNAFK